MFQKDLKRLSTEIKQILLHEVHCSGEESKFPAIKKEVLTILNALFGETSREFRVVQLTSSPATVGKVLKHIANRDHLTRDCLVINH